MGIWTPAWIVNAILLYASIHICIDKPKYNDDGELIETDEEDKVTIQVKILTFIQTVLIILLQVFIMCKLDGDLDDWKWSGVFAPWFMYEGQAYVYIMTVYTCVNMRLYVYVDVYEYIMCDLSVWILKLCVDINTLYRY